MRGRGKVLAVGALLGLAAIGCGNLARVLMGPNQPPEDQRGISLADLPAGAVHTVAEGLEIPWAIALLPDGGLLVTERPGRLLRLPRWLPGDPPLRPDFGERWEIPGVTHVGEGGLMGVAVHPGYPEVGWIYLMLTGEGPDGLENRVERYRLGVEGPSERTVIVDGIPGNRFHNGGRIAFGPDGHLYIATGDAGDPGLAQDPGALAGKILRLTAEGAIPPDNPFQSPVWSLGHRNVQGLAWDAAGRLWSTEHGRSGLRSGLDELNRIVPGANYGWPLVEGDETMEETIPPVLQSGPEYTWAPAGIAHAGGRLYFGGLRGEALYEATVEGEGIETFVAHFATELGRIRAVVSGPDGTLYLATSNRDGRGRPGESDDRILRLDPSALRP